MSDEQTASQETGGAEPERAAETKKPEPVVNDVTGVPDLDMRSIWRGDDQVFRTYDGRICTYGLKMLDAVLGRSFAQAPVSEKAAFLAYCIGQQLDPIRKHVYFVKYKSSEPAAFITSWEVFLERAGQHPQFDGIEKGIVWAVRDGDVERVERGKPCDYKLDENHEIIGGWAVVYRKDQTKPCEVEVPLGEMQGRKADGSVTRFWRTMPTTMATKVPSARALRQAFPDILGGLFVEEENRSFASARDLEVGSTVPPKDLEEVCDGLEGESSEPRDGGAG